MYELRDDPPFLPKRPLAGRTFGYLYSQVCAWLQHRFTDWTPPPLDEDTELSAMSDCELELHLLGGNASIEQLETHLAKAPEEGGMVSYVFIAGARRANQNG